MNVNKTFRLRDSFLVYKLGGGKLQGISNKTIRENEKIIDYRVGKPCPVCHMIKDVGEKGECQYCLNVYCNEGDSDG